MSINLPSKSQLIDEAIWFDAIASQAIAKAKSARAKLEEIARAEYEVDGVAPSWRHPNCTVPLAISTDRYEVGDRQKWMDWVAERYPSEVEEITQVRPNWEKAMLDGFAKQGELACTPDGEIPPGLVFIPGGTPKGISIRYGKGVKDTLAEMAATTIDQLAPGQKELAE